LKETPGGVLVGLLVGLPREEAKRLRGGEAVALTIDIGEVDDFEVEIIVDRVAGVGADEA
jgi:hypothetical protein